LKAELWFRRGRLFMVSPVRGDHRRLQAETPLIGLFKFAGPALYAHYFPTESPARIFLHVPSWPGPFDVEVDCVAVL
jgi:hypothetical protein